MKKTILFFFCSLLWGVSFAQEVNVTGIVTYSEDGLSIPGATIVVKGSQTNGTLTDVDGNYTITTSKGKTLVFSSIGCKSIEIIVGTSSRIDVVLEPDAKMLNEFVYIGYGSVRKSDVTGAVTSVQTEKLQRTPAAGLDQALQGRAAGVTVNASSGQPGAAAEIRIRGVGTVNNSSPLYVVDGVITDNISFLSPNDIISTEILKDASASAIYGSRGANGVILFTTRKGGSDGKVRVSLDGYAGVQNKWKKLDLMKSKEFAETLITLNNLKSEKNYYNKNGFNSWLSTYRLGESPYFPVIKSADHPNGFDYSGVETDWQEEVFQDNAMIQNYHVSVDGGNSKSAYSISGSYFTQDGIIIGSDFSRLTLRINSSSQINKAIKIGENLSFTSSQGRNAMANNANPAASILSAAIAMAPWDPTHYPQGAMNIDGRDLSGQISASSNFKNVTNPFSMVQHSHPSDKTERWMGNVYLEITPLKGLTFRSDVSLDLENTRNQLFKDAYQYSGFDQNKINFFSSTMGRQSQVIVNNILTFSKDIDKHSFSIMGGQTTQETNFYSIGGSGSGILNPSERNRYLNQTTKDRSYANDIVWRTRMFSLLSRAQYSYNNRYLATFTIRADGSSKFPLNPWGYFPSTALAWRLSEESWMKDIPNLDNLKLRLGWGRLGNDKIPNDAFTMKMFNAGPTFVDYVLGASPNQALANGAAVLSYVDQNGRWEVGEQWNAGIDFAFFKTRLSGTIDLYLKDTRDMILPVKAPANVGNRYDPQSNVGTVRNQGIELTLTYEDKLKTHSGPFNYSITGNVSFNKNELKKLNGGQRIYDRDGYRMSDEGLPLFTLWGYEYEGIYKSDKEALDYLYAYKNTPSEIPYHAGDARFRDLNGDGKIDDADKTNLGNPFPWLSYGLNLGGNWNRLDIQVFFQGVSGNELYNAMRIRTEGPGNEATMSTEMHDAWTPSNTNGTIPNPLNSVNYASSSRFVESAAYLRLKNIQIGYTLPTTLTQKWGMETCRLYVTANNLLTITNYKGYDPELVNGIDYGNYPQARTFLLGFNINF